MGQVTLYLDNETEKKMVTSARAMKLSKSEWIAGVIQEKLVTKWPATVREMAGTWQDFPTPEQLRADPGEDTTQR